MGMPKLLALLLVPAYGIFIAILLLLDIHTVFEPPLLFPVLNTLLVGILPVYVAYMAGRVYLQTGSASSLFMGCGMLTLGLGATSSGWSIGMTDGPNIAVTILDTGALVGGFFHALGSIFRLVGRISLEKPGTAKRTIATAYGCVSIFVVIFTLAAMKGLIPQYFIQGVGPTTLRQVVVATAVILYAFPSVLYMLGYARWKSDFLYWYSLALSLFAIGMGVLFMVSAVGGPIAWLGRSALYFGGLFSLAAIVTATRIARHKGIPIESVIANFFADAEASYRDLVETARDAIISFDQDGRIIGWNSAAEIMFGHSKGAAIGSVFSDLLIPKPSVSVLQQQIESIGGTRLRKSPSIRPVEIEGKRRDGSLFPIEISVSVRELPTGRVTTCIIRDITERKRVEKALQAASAYNRSLIEASLDPLVTISAQGRITDVNTATERVTGRSRNELIGTDFAHYFTNPEKAEAGYQQVFKEGSVKDYELEIRHKNGLVIPVMYNASVYRDEFGEITGVFAAARDISDLKQADKKLAAHARNLELANAELDQFTYVASHDLQAPLRKLISFSDLLREDLGEDLPQVAAADLGFITDAATRMQTLVLDLLLLSRIGKAAVKYEKIPLQECADAAMANLSRKIEETNAEIIRDQLPVVLGDRTLLTQLYQNLIGNSLHYRADNRPKIRLTCENTEENWVLGVLDNGIGIQPEYLDQIFLPFKRLHTRQEYEGTGIGLSICRKVVNLCGGHIWAESDGKNQGAHFKFTLKRLEENQK